MKLPATYHSLITKLMEYNTRVLGSYHKTNNKSILVNIATNYGTTRSVLHIDLTDEEMLMFDDLVRFILQNFGEKDDIMNNVLIINNHVDCDNQPYHYDFKEYYKNVFICLVDMTTDNATEYVTLNDTDFEKRVFHYLVDNMIITESRDELAAYLASVYDGHINIKFEQCIGRKYDIFELDYHKIHRAIKNRGTYDRPLLNFGISKNMNTANNFYSAAYQYEHLV